jgi:acetoacetyl-CoA reductase
VFNMTKPVCDGMVERGWGRIVNISSVNGSKGSVGQTNYAAAKAGMHGFTIARARSRAQGRDGEHGVARLSRDEDGHGDPAGHPRYEDPAADPGGAPRPTGGSAALVAYLCSEAGFVTGSNIAINGGQHMH